MSDCPLTLPAPAYILLLEDAPGAQRDILLCLRQKGHQVEPTTHAALLAQASRRGHDLALMVPGTSTRGSAAAWQALRRLRQQGGPMPVLALLRASHPADRAIALDLGADAVLDLPAHPGELLARIAALLRRARAPQEPSTAPTPQALWAGGWRLEPERRQLHPPQGRPITLSDPQWQLLQACFEQPHVPAHRLALLAMAQGQAATSPPLQQAPLASLHNPMSGAAPEADPGRPLLGGIGPLIERP